MVDLEKLYWSNYSSEQKKRRLARLPRRTEEIQALAVEGYRIKQLTPYQFRVNDVVDLFPIHNRYHDLDTGRRGGYRYAQWFIRSYFKRINKE